VRRRASSRRAAICSSVISFSSGMAIPPPGIKDVSLGTMGKCVYCGSETPPLTKEHIVPRGLNGHLYLDEASCEDCRKITAEFEREVQNKMFWLLRYDRNIRGLKDKHPEIPIKAFLNDGSVGRTKAPSEAIPLGAYFPIFGPAKMLEKHLNLSHERQHLGVRYFIDLNRIEASRKIGIQGFPSEIPVFSFKRMLCKIAHCTAVAEYGLDRFEPFLCDLIRGKSKEFENFLEANPKAFQRHEEDLHTIEFITDGDLLIAEIRLFASIGAPFYYVVTGRAKRAPFPRNTSV
jgi:hypothetical protein